jgi:predicted AlkP superfamily phosphohydrolase/phosphomutase
MLNVAGREPQGIIPQNDYETVRNTLSEKLSAIPDPDGHPLATHVFKPEETYKTCNGIPPDLIVYFGDLLWRSVGTLGHASIHTLENDTGPDDANHAQFGIFILKDGLHHGLRSGLDIRDVAPTVLSLMELPIPADMQGNAIVSPEMVAAPSRPVQSEQTDDVYTDEEKEALEKRLKSLGYL